MRPFGLLLALAAATAEAATPPAVETFADGGLSWKYAKLEVRGWTLYLHADLLAKDDPEKKRAFRALIAVLTAQLKQVEKVVPGVTLPTLKRTKLWASDEPGYPLRAGEHGLMTRHRDAGWLRANGLNPAMAGGIHIVNPGQAVFTDRLFEMMPMCVLHELTHALHGAVLTGGKDAEIRRTYEAAMSAGLYDSVPERGGGAGRERAYAASDKEEYLAELTEAYFGRNDYCPETRADLYRHDPRGLRLVEEMWGVATPYQPEAVAAADSPCGP